MNYLMSKISSQITMLRNYFSNKRSYFFKHYRHYSDEYQSYLKAIHSIIFLYDVADSDFKLMRVGSKRDGGYIMVTPMSKNKIAYSMGICDNIDWEAQMVNMGYDVFMYDHTIDKLPKTMKGFHWFKVGICGTPPPTVRKHSKSIL